MSELPIIDLSPFRSDDIAAKETVAQAIYKACHEIGFFYIKNHGIDTNLIEQVFDYSKYFFDLPLEEKQKIACKNALTLEALQGYAVMKTEDFKPDQFSDFKESLNFLELDKFPTDFFIPPAIPTFIKACTEVGNNILQAFSLALELPEDFLTTKHNKKQHDLRLLHYPALQQTAKPQQIRIGEHTDFGTTTLLFQDDVGGLEVQNKSGDWIAAPNITDTILVNTGDIMQRWTNDIFCSTKHRVIIPDENKAKCSRYSVAFFCNPNLDTEITCLETCQKDKPPIYSPIIVGESFLKRLQSY